MDNNPYDVTIVGGGPAGTTAAIHLARRGRRVCLVEKDTHPRYKVCGGGVLARAVNLLPVSLDAAVEQLCHRVELHFWGKGLQFSAERSMPIIYMVMRVNMDMLLLSAAKKCGVEVLENYQARDLAEGDGGVTLFTDRKPIMSRFLIAADGVNSIMAQKAGWPANSFAIPAMECEVPLDPPTLQRFRDVARFDLDHPVKGYSWVFPKKEHLSVGVLTIARGPVDLKDALRIYLERLNIIAAAPLKPRGALIPVRPRPGPPARGRILLAGDAYGLAEPICAEGISNALQSGMLTARAIIDGGMDPARVESIYNRDLKMSLLRELEAAVSHARLLYGHRYLRNLLFRFKGEMFCENLVGIMMGERRFADIGGPLRMLLRETGWWRQERPLDA